MKYYFILCILFSLAFLTRLDSLLDSRELPGRQAFTFSTIGSGSDQDYQMHCALGKTSEALTHYDYLFLCPLMTFTFRHLNFIDGLTLITFVLLLSGCVVAVFPYLLFSSKEKISIGGVIGSLILIFNSVMIDDSSGRFFIYPLVSFVYIIYVWVLWQAIHKKTLFWTNAFATVAALQSLNKPFLFVSDIPFIFIFCLLLMIENISFKKSFPYIQMEINWNHLNKSIIALTIYFGISIYFEIIHYLAVGQFSFLTDLFVPTSGPSTKDAVLGASLHFKGAATQKFINILGLSMMGALLTLKYLKAYLLIGLGIVSILLKKKKIIIWAIFLMLIILLSTVSTYFFYSSFIRTNVVIPFPSVRKYHFILMSVFVAFVFKLVLFKKDSLALVGTQIFYLAALSLTLAAVSQNQLFVTLIIWVALLIAFSIKEGFESFLTRFSTRTRVVSLILVLLTMFSTIWPLLSKLPTSFRAIQNEVRYLKWVATVVPADSYIIGGASDNLLLVSKITKKTVLTNGFFVAAEIKPDNFIWDNKEFKPGFPQFVKKTMSSSDQAKFYILDHDIPRWKSYLQSGASETYPKNRYMLKEVASSGYLERKIYVLAKNPEYVEVEK
ncbi:MAG: hypothetical protein ABI425_00885 [Patescibacteria group bacterium]